MVTGAAVWAIRSGTGSSALLIPGMPFESLLAAQLFVAAAAVTALVVAALYAERIRAEASLAESQASLARDVAERTRAEEKLRRQVISERKAKDSLRASEESLKRSQEIANLGDWAWDTRTNRVRWSGQMYRIFGIDRASVPEDIDLAEVIRRAIHPDDRDRVLAANETVVREGRPVEMEYRVVREDGTVRVVRATPGGARADEQGQVVELWGVVQDVTESRLAERQLEESHRLLAGDYRWLFVRERVFQRDAANRPELLFGVCQDITDRKLAEPRHRHPQPAPQAVLAADAGRGARAHPRHGCSSRRAGSLTSDARGPPFRLTLSVCHDLVHPHQQAVRPPGPLRRSLLPAQPR